MLPFLLAVLPIGFLLVVMTKPKPLPSTRAFALAAVLAYGLGWLYFDTPLLLLNAGVLKGVLDALTPISIVFGAILFFVAMEKSGAMATVQTWLRGLSDHPVAQIMIVGFAFIFLIEAAAGFGSPAALAAPILVALGFPALRVAVLCLVFNTIPTAFGAAGTPVWFGFELLKLPREAMHEIAWQGALFQACAGLVVPIVALRLLVPWRTIAHNLVFILLCLLACIVPMLVVASFSYEFPAVAGGVIGLPVAILMARYDLGLEPPPGDPPRAPLWSPAAAAALVPLSVAVLVLLITRLPQFGLRDWLTSSTPILRIPLGVLGEASISASLVVQLRDILGQDLSWSHALLFVPSLLPFVPAAALTLLQGRCGKADYVETLRATLSRIGTPVLALFGALVFVNLLMVGGDRAPTMILGRYLAEAAGGAWAYAAPFLGALGSFFSGSTTISNLTFGAIQASIAEETGASVPSLLALQLSGAAMGNMFCIHNIVAVCAVLSLVNEEGVILRKTLPPLLLYAGVMALVVLLKGLAGA